VGKSPKINFYRLYQSGKVPKNQFLSTLPEWESPQIIKKNRFSANEKSANNNMITKLYKPKY